MPRPQVILNIIALNVCWTACVLGQSYGFPYLGPAVVAAALIIQFGKSLAKPKVISFFIEVTVIGAIVDVIIIKLGGMNFPCCSLLPENYPWWMVALWVSFSTSYFSCLYWLRDKALLGGILGAVGGIGAYYGGAKLNALLLGDNLTNSLIIIGVAWGIAFPLLGALHRKAFPSATTASNV